MPYHAVITIRQDILDTYPDLAADLNRPSGMLTEDIITTLIGYADPDGEGEDVVSHE